MNPARSDSANPSDPARGVAPEQAVSGAPDIAGGPYARIIERAFDQAPHLAGVLRLDGTVLHANRAACAFIGATPASVVGLPFWEAPWWRDLPEEQQKLRESVAHAARGEPWRFETWHRAPDGVLHPFDFAIVPVRDGDHGVIALVVQAWNIAERHRASEEIRRITNEQQTILHTITTGICLVRDRRIQWSNPAFADIFGLQREEVVGVETLRLYARSDDYERIGREGYALLASGKGFTTEAQMKRKDGTLIWCVISGRAVDTLRPESGSIWELHDITKRRQAEEALRKSQNRLEAAQAQALIGSWDLDPIRGDGYWSDEMFHLMGLSPELGTPNVEAFIEMIHPEDRDALLRAHALTIKTGEHSTIECRSNPSLGPVRYFCANIRGARDALGHVGNLIGTLQDITDRKRAEREHAQLQEQLQQAMKMEAVGRLAGGVAHDFNNQLTVILGNLELMRDSIPDNSPDAVCLAEATHAAESAASLTRQLLAFSRRQMIEPRVLNLNELVENLKNMLRRLIGEDIILQTALAPDIEPVNVDPGQFEQVLVNLSINARDAMPSGGRLVIATANVELDDFYCRLHAGVQPGRFAMLSVSDTGQGMPPEVREHLFEPFFTTKALGHGTGLGLATTFGAVKQSGGSIEVYSEVGRGTTLKLYLPKAQGPIAPLVPKAKPADSQRGSETILLVEDDASVRALASTVLRKHGYNVLVAASAADARELTEKFTSPVDLLLTDVVMPGTNGKELADQLRQIHPEMAVIFSSGYTEDVIVHHGIVEAHLNFLGKPFTTRSLLAKVRQTIDSRKTADRA